MQLYNTKVVPAGEDLMWELPQGLPSLAEAKLLVLSVPHEPGSAEEQTLVKMMAASKLSPPAYAVIQLGPSQRLSWRALAAAGVPANVLMLGIAPAQLAISAMFRLNYCNPFLGCTFIPSYSLAQIGQDAAMKRALWEGGLKPCFSL